MAGSILNSARVIANAALKKFDAQGGYASAALDKLLSRTDQKQRATDLVFGTVRNREAIDMLIAKFSGRPIERISPSLLNIIRIAVYELVYVPETAQHAIVNEAVEITATAGGKKQTGFVNAVLRQITRQITERSIALDKGNLRRTLPQTIATGCEFDIDILPDPRKSAGEYLSKVFSLPAWLVCDWIAEFGEETASQICFASNRRPCVYIRPNPLKTTINDLVEKFEKGEIDFALLADQAMLKVKGSISKLPGFIDGLFSVQDITAAKVVTAISPRLDWKILDLCAAPGTKTCQLAELSCDKAKIFAADIDPDRLKKLKENYSRLSLKSIKCVEYENAGSFGPFDCILLDVPCSNTGVLSKRPEVRFRITRKAITARTKIQLQLLKKAASMIKPAGKICYSTCSIQPDENNKLIKEFLEINPSFQLEAEQLTLPGAERFDHDGGYFAILVKNSG